MIALHAGAPGSSVLTSWSLDPLVLISVPLLVFLYARGLRLLPHKRFHATWRPWAFYVGAGVVSLALLSPLDVFSDDLFWVHMVQHLLLMLVAAPLIILSAPVLPIVRGIPYRLRLIVVVGPMHSAAPRALLRFLTQPLIAWGLMVGTLIFWHIPGPFEAALRNEGIHLLEHFTFAGTAYLFWWNVIDPLPFRPRMSYLIRVPYTFVTVVPAFVLGAFLSFSSEAWYAPYVTSAPEYGMTALEDQQLGGLIMWIPGSFIIGAAVFTNLAYAVMTEQRRQAEREHTPV